MRSRVINVHKEDAELMPVFESWWLGHGVKTVPVAILPQCGVLVEGDEGSLAVGWLYMDNSVGVAWEAWVTTSPALRGLEVLAVLGYLNESLEEVADELGYGLLFTMSDRPSLVRYFERHGWERNHSGMTQLFKAIGGKHGS